MAYEGMINSALVYFSKFDTNGDEEGYQLIGNATSFSLTPSATRVIQKSFMQGTYGQALAAVSLPGETAVSIGMNTIDSYNLALALMGTSAAHSVTGATVADESVTAPSVLDNAFKVANPYDISAITITPASSTTPYTSGTDYEILDAANGLVKVLSTGTISASESLLIDYTYGSQTGSTVSGGTVTEIDGYWLLNLKNLATSKYSTVSFRAVLSSSSAIELISEDWTPLTLEGIVIGSPTYTLKD